MSSIRTKQCRRFFAFKITGNSYESIMNLCGSLA